MTFIEFSQIRSLSVYCAGGGAGTHYLRCLTNDDQAGAISTTAQGLFLPLPWKDICRREQTAYAGSAGVPSVLKKWQHLRAARHCVYFAL
jgi:hypothetical protein